MNTKFRISASTFAIALMVLVGPVSANYITGSENVSGSRVTPQYGDATLLDNAGNPGPFGPYGWNFSYTRSFDGTKLTKDVEINFTFDAGLGYTNTQKTAYKNTIETNIEGIWNNKFEIKDTANGKKFPITVDVTTGGPFNQTVQVHAGSGRADMLNWFVNDGAAVNAHEFGHMLGLFDEYIGGAIDQYPNPTLSNDGLMGLGALNPNPVMYSRYYQQYLDYMNVLNPRQSFALVPEPSVWALLCLGMALMLMMTGRVRNA
jgi:hypothetical protein